MDAIVSKFDGNNTTDDDNNIRFSIIGRPNVGKSSIVNSILGENRVIVADMEGTTRDAIDTIFEKDGQKYTIVDTAGIRRKGKVYEKVEKYSVMRSISAIEQSDVAIIVIDASVGIIEQDKHIAGYAHDAGKGVIIAVNKWDVPYKTTTSCLLYTSPSPRDS